MTTPDEYGRYLAVAQSKRIDPDAAHSDPRIAGIKYASRDIIPDDEPYSYGDYNTE